MIHPGSITTVEAIRREDTQYGIALWQLTSAPAIHTNIYLETPFMDASSRYVLFTRSRDSYGPVEVWRADLEQHWLTPVCAGAPQYTHAHPYFSPDRRTVIFNSDRTGIPHIYAACLPDGLLEQLDT